MEGTTNAGAKLDPAFVEDWGMRYLEAWNSLDADGVAALCSDDVAWNDPGLREPAHGREGVRAFVRATGDAFADFHVEERGQPYISVDEPRVLSRYRMTGTMLGPWEYTNLAATGHRIDVLGVDEWTFSGELMSSYETYYDSLDMARQLGILPPGGSAVERAMAGLQHLQARIQRRKTQRAHPPSSVSRSEVPRLPRTGGPAQPGYSSLRQARGSSGPSFGVRSSRNE